MRTMLLPLTSEETDKVAIQTGFSLARKLDAHVTFLLARPEFDVPIYAHSVTAAGYAAMMHALQTDAELRETSVRQLLVAAAAEQGVSIALNAKAPQDAQASFEIGLGDDDDVLRRYAAVNDVILFPRTSRPGDSLEAPSLLKTALQYSGRPILVATDEPAANFGNIVAIAWNGSSEGARAVTAALPILCRAEDVVILTVATGKTKAKEGEALRRYLLHHGVTSRTERLDEEAHVGQELISAASLAGATLLVSGGYTHSRMRQTLFGGVTHHLLENCTVPLLLAH